jgi:hypothetical protein
MNEVTFPAFFSDAGVTLRYCSENCRDQEPVKNGYHGAVAAADIPEEYGCDMCGADLSALAGERLAEASRTDFMAEFDPLDKGQGEAFCAAVDRIMSMSFKQLASETERMTMDQRRDFADHFRGLAATAARIGTYLEWRGGCGYDQGHESAVKKQNTVGRQVRKAQGYSNTPDINF